MEWVIEAMSTKHHETVDNEQSLTSRRDNVLIRVLLRFYAKNLRRSWRNTPHQAFVDATLQTEVLVVLTLAWALVLLWIIFSRAVFPSLAHLGEMKNGDLSEAGAFVVVGLVMIVYLWLERKLKPYEFMRGVELRYDSDHDRTIVIWCYVYAFSIILLGSICAAYIGRLFPIR